MKQSKLKPALTRWSAFSSKKTIEMTGKLTNNFPSKTDMSSKYLFQTFMAFHSLLPNGV